MTNERVGLWIYHLAVVWAAWWWLLEGSFPFFNLTQVWATLAVVVLMIGWVAMVFRRLDRKPRRLSAWHAIAPSVFAVMLVVGSLGIPLDIRWRVSRTAYEQIVADPTLAELPDGESLRQLEPLGRPHAQSVWRDGDRLRFYLTHSNQVGLGCVLYAPSGVEHVDDRASLVHVEGPWYWC